MPTGEKVDEVFDSLGEEDDYGHLQDATEEIRSGYDEETDISCEFSRHYEAKSVARKMSDGSWVGWTYWYGGGKHGEPESIDWMDSAYDAQEHVGSQGACDEPSGFQGGKRYVWATEARPKLRYS